MSKADNDRGTPWWIWLLVVLGVLGLGVCVLGGYVVYQMRNYDPTYHYRSGDEPPPCLPGRYFDVRGACSTCPSDEPTACLYQEMCIDGPTPCLRAGACLESPPERIEYCTE